MFSISPHISLAFVLGCETPETSRETKILDCFGVS